MNLCKFLLILPVLYCFGCESQKNHAVVLVEAESFNHWGGWVLDQQSIDQMGSPYLMAHGLGVQVKDASTTVKFEKLGTYKFWVRTRDWTAPWKTAEYKNDTVMLAHGYPGKFRLAIAGKVMDSTFGTKGNKWQWSEGGVVDITEHNTK